MVQPAVNALGKKYSTMACLASASLRLNELTLPPSVESAVKSGAVSPTESARAGPATSKNRYGSGRDPNQATKEIS